MSRFCTDCEATRINGIVCHETGCQSSWKSETRGCKWCGQDFKPNDKFQKCCDHSCTVIYNNDTCDCTECSDDFGYIKR